MRRNSIFKIIAITGVCLIAAAGILMVNVNPVGAQCGSSASSCKNCHEVQGEMVVNTDGTAWHTSHAFGDFCYICHAGNQQVMDKNESHASMVPPLSDIKASCQQCHLDDLQERAQVYASALDIEIGINPTGNTSDATPESNTSTEIQPIGDTPINNEIDMDDPNLVNYVENYDRIVLGKNPTNWGNVILLVMIGMLVVGGGGFVIMKEKLVNVTFGDTKKIEGEYPEEIVDMLPAIKQLNPKLRKSLKNVLDQPDKADKVLRFFDEITQDEREED
ncbi:hypothetical protein ACFLXB_00160 [Chloroflexota bacterium]